MGVITTTEIPSGVVFGPLHVAKAEEAAAAPNADAGRSSGVSGGVGAAPSSDPVSHVGVTIKDRRSEDEEINEVRESRRREGCILSLYSFHYASF